MGKALQKTLSILLCAALAVGSFGALASPAEATEEASAHTADEAAAFAPLGGAATQSGATEDVAALGAAAEDMTVQGAAAAEGAGAPALLEGLAATAALTPYLAPGEDDLVEEGSGDVVPGLVITIEQDEFDDTTLRIPQGVAVADTDLLVGVSAVDENDADVPVTVKDTDELDMANPQPKGTPGEPEPYLITYEAVHPVTDETFTATRECYVTLGAADIVPLAGEFQVEGGGTYDSLLAAEAAVPNGGTITMLGDVTVSSTAYLYSGKTLTLNMNGHTLSTLAISDPPPYLLRIYGGTRVTITGGGSFINNNASFAVQVTGDSHVNILNGYFEAADDALYCTSGTVVIAAGTFKATAGSDGCIFGSGISLAPGSTSNPPYPWGYASEVTVSAAADDNNAFLSALTYSVGGGTAVSVPDFNSYVYEYDVVLSPLTDLTAQISIDATPVIPGAAVGTDPISPITLVGGEGTVTITVTATDGYPLVPYTVNFRVGAANFKTGGDYYETLEEAEDAVANGGTITMHQDVAVPSDVGLYSGKNFTLDLGTYTLSSNGSPGDLLKISDGTELTITGGGSVINSVGGSAVYVDYSSSLNILSGHFEAEEDAIFGSGTVVITAGTFVATDDFYEDGCLYGEGISIAEGSLATPFDWREINATSVTVAVVTPQTNPFLSTLTYSIDGGTYVPVPNYDPQVPEYDVVLSHSTSLTALVGINAVPAESGAAVSIEPASPFNLVNGERTAEITVTAADGATQVIYTVNFQIGAANFSTGGNTYETLEEAVDAVTNNGTITMLQNVVVPSIAELYTNKTFTINLGGYTLSGGENAFGVLLIGYQTTATIQNGSIVNDNGICLAVEGTATLSNLNVEATSGMSPGFAVYNEGQTLIVSGEYYGSEGAVYAEEGSVEIILGRFWTDAGYNNPAFLVEASGAINLYPGSVANPPQADWPTASEVVVTVAPTQHPVTQHFGTFDGSGTRSATVDADHTGFVQLEKDGQIVDQSHYSITPGSTVITLTEAHMSAHENGEHTYRAVFEDGYANLNLTVAVPASDTPGSSAIPHTGDNSLTVWIIVLLALALGILGIFVGRKRRQDKGLKGGND